MAMGMRINISNIFRGSKNFARKIFNYIFQGGDITDELQQVIDTKLLDVVTDIMLPAIKQKLVENESVFTGALYNGLFFSQAEPGKVALNVTPNVNYARILESGSNPRGVDNDEGERIVRWVVHKIGTEDNSKLIAAAVIAKIEGKGNDPHPFIMPAVAETIESVKSAFGKEISIELGL